MARATGSPSDKTLDELIAIKKLLVFGLIRGRASQSQIASALGVDQSQVSRLFPSGAGRAAKAVKKSSK